MGVQEVKCGDEEETDKFQSMSEFGQAGRGQDKEADLDGEKPMEEDAPFVVQINFGDEEREKLHFIGELGLV
jgi:hypothetical protein